MQSLRPVAGRQDAGYGCGVFTRRRSSKQRRPLCSDKSAADAPHRRNRAWLVAMVAAGPLLAGSVPAGALAAPSSDPLGVQGDSPLSEQARTRILRDYTRTQVDARVTDATVQATLDADPYALSSYQKAYGLKAEAARRALSLQSRVPNLEAVLVDRFGDGLAGISFDNTVGEWILYVTDAVDADAADKEMADLRLGGAYRLERVAAGRRSLAEARELAERWVANEGVRASVGFDPRGAELEIDPDDHVKLGASLNGLKNDLSGLDGAPALDVRTESAAPAEPTGCWIWTGTVEPTTLRICSGWTGGAYYELPNNHRCTGGFYAAWPGSSDRYTLTAGHCVWDVPYQSQVITVNPDDGGSWRPFAITGYWEYGSWSSPGDGSADIGMLAMTGGNISSYAGYFNWNSGGLSTVGSVLMSPPAAGTWVCINGAATGTSCGQVTNGDVNASVGSPLHFLQHMIRVVGTCSDGGDSGSPMTLAAAGTAVGIASASSHPGSCTANNYFSPVYRATARWGIMVKTA